MRMDRRTGSGVGSEREQTVRGRSARPLLVLLVTLVVPIGAQAEGQLANGDSPTGELSTVGQVDTWTFGAGVGDTVLVQIGELSGTAFEPVLRLLDPNGVQVASNSGNASTNVSHQALVPGIYTVEVSDSSSNGTGTYRIYLGRIPGSLFVPPGDEGGPLASGDVHPGTIDLGDLDLWTYEADALDTAIVQIGEVSSTSFLPFILLYGPDGSLITSNSGNFSANLAHQATVAGTYTVVVRDGNTDVIGTGSYELYFANLPDPFVVPAGDEGGALTNGEIHPGTLALGDLDLWTYEADTLDTAIVQIGEVSGTSFLPLIRLYGPDGSLITSNSGNFSANLAHQATVAGTYTVVVRDGNTDVTGTGSYELYFVQAPDAFIVPSGDEGGSLASGSPETGDIDLADLDPWTFELDALDSALVEITELTPTSFSPFIRLYDPSGSFIASASASLNHQAVVAGTYTVVVSDGNTDVIGVGDYELELTLTPDSTTPPAGAPIGTLENGGVVNGTYDTPTDVDLYDLGVTAGDQVRMQLIDAAGSTSVSPLLQVFASSGSLLASSSGSAAARVAFRASATETLTVVATKSGTGTGPYDLYTAIAPGAFVTPGGDEGGVLGNGDVASGSLPLGDIDLYSLALTAGDHVRLQLTDAGGSTSVTPFLQVFAGDGSLLASSSGSALARVTFRAEATETATVVAFNASTGNGSYDLYTAISKGAFVTPAGDEGGLLGSGVTVAGVFTLGDIDLFSLAVLAGDAVDVSATDTTPSTSVSPVLEVYDADGERIAQEASGSTASVAFEAEESETLRLLVYNSGTGVGTYDLLGNVTTPVDSDGDGLPDEAEIVAGTAIDDPDTDDDGVSDFDEVNWDGDIDFNPALDLDPLDTDTDDDLVADGREIELGSDPKDPGSIPFVPAPVLAAPVQLLLAGALLLAATSFTARAGAPLEGRRRRANTRGRAR